MLRSQFETPIVSSRYHQIDRRTAGRALINTMTLTLDGLLNIGLFVASVLTLNVVAFAVWSAASALFPRRRR